MTAAGKKKPPAAVTEGGSFQRKGGSWHATVRGEMRESAVAAK